MAAQPPDNSQAVTRSNLLLCDSNVGHVVLDMKIPLVIMDINICLVYTLGPQHPTMTMECLGIPDNMIIKKYDQHPNCVTLPLQTNPCCCFHLGHFSRHSIHTSDGRYI